MLNSKQNSSGLSSRRRFLVQAGAVTVASCSGRGAVALALPMKPPENRSQPAAAIKNRSPLAENAFYVLPLGSVVPAGWLRRQLEIQANGLSGHLDETWPDVGSNSGWLGGSGESWERFPYFLDGLVPLAWSLDDARLKNKVQRFLDWTLNNQRPNGMIGPKSNDDWWPRMVMLKALAQYQEATGDPRVIPLLERYFAYQLQTLPSRPLRDWGKFRWQDNALSVLWLYNRNGDKQLLELAVLLHEQGHDWQAQFADFKFTQRITPEFIKLNDHEGLGDLALSTHGVNNAQAIKAGPVWFLISHKDNDREAAQVCLDALDRYHGLPNGMFSCDEHFAGREPSQGSELCSVVETMFSLEQSLAILGNSSLGDRLERLAFNALPGAFRDDMWSHQYNQEPNQVECSMHHKPWTTDGPESNLYGLEPNFGCCTANFHQGWPKFTASLWMASHDEGLVAAAYSPCDVKTSVRGTALRLSEETDYPFKGRVRIGINPATPIEFPLRLRIPSWAATTSIRINEKSQSTPMVGEFALFNRTWSSGDVVELQFSMEPKLVRGYNRSISMERGPLIFSYPIGESWVKLRDRGMTADWQAFPTTSWNYALALDEQDIQQLDVEENSVGSVPFGLEGTAVKLKVTARKLASWQAVDGAAEPPPESPVASNEHEEEIDLVPYAAAKLRITAFPQTSGRLHSNETGNDE
jgi:hypothetical protein